MPLIQIDFWFSFSKELTEYQIVAAIDPEMDQH
jgi:hypothetical protein